MRRVLLDTIRSYGGAPTARSLGRKRAHYQRCHGVVSVASAWEIAIKISTGKLELAIPVETLFREHLVAHGFELLPIALGHVTHVQRLAFHHRDPFDRLLAVQALQESLEIASVDKVFTRYGDTRVWG
jgi:PIN domain nuclease of toxin-antitoxin system